MKLALFYDTETTGLPLFSEPSEHPGQPHSAMADVQACMAVYFAIKNGEK